jgi:hypothetical protein
MGTFSWALFLGGDLQVFLEELQRSCQFDAATMHASKTLEVQEFLRSEPWQSRVCSRALLLSN